MAGPKKPAGEKLEYSFTCMFTKSDMALIQSLRDELGISKGAAVRIYLRRGARGPATPPFTPEGDQQ